jgi:hypothetical protein
MNDAVPTPAASPDASPPRHVAWLGYGGLVPFVGLAAASLLGVEPRTTSLALLAYGAVILSFVGALHWAFAMLLPQLAVMRRTWMYAWSTVPALIAWCALLLEPRVGSVILVMTFALHYLQDRRLSVQGLLPAWYLPLRLRLSMVAIICLLAPGLKAAMTGAA